METVTCPHRFGTGETRLHRLAIGGKGGSGKTTISSTLSRLFGRQLGSVLAVDGDPNPNLSTALGIRRDGLWPLLPSTLLTHEEVNGKRVVRLTQPVSEILERYSVPGPDGVQLLALGEVENAGKG